MKNLFYLLLSLVLIAINIEAQVPRELNYQGVLKDASGNNVTDGNYSITFKIYNEASAGTALWSETQTVVVANGVFAARLGSVTPLEGVPFNTAHYLGITIRTETELTPRTVFTSSPYSFMSMDIVDNIITASKIQDGAITGNKIAGNQVVKSINGLKDDVTFLAGTNITLTPSGNNITINAAGGGGGSVTQVNTGLGLTGGPITTTGTISIPNDGVTSAMLQSNSVTSAKITDGTITSADIGATQVVKALNNIKDNVTLVAGTNVTITPSGNNLTIASTSTGVGGSGTTNYIPRFTAATTLGNSAIFQSGTNLGIGTTSPTYPLHLNVNNTAASIYSVNNATGVTSTGVYGEARQLDYYGYGGNFIGGWIGVRGSVTPSGINAYYGVYGSVSGGTSPAGNRFGVYGIASGTGTGNRYGVYASASGGTINYAGYFVGNVTVNGTLSKGGGSFKIDHPLDPANKYLYHSFVESPDMMNIYNGNVVTDGSGYAAVSLPDWFEALNKDFRYQLTVIGDFAQAIIAQEVQGNQFVLRTDKPNIKVSWQVTGIRKDAFAEKNRIPVEEMKPTGEIGKYIHPEVYGLPETMSIDYERNREITERK